MLCEAMDDGKDPLLADNRLMELPNQVIIVLEDLTDAEHERSC